MNDKNKMAGADFITSIVFIVLGAVVFGAAAKMRVFRTLVVSPGLFPMILGGVFVVCGLVMLVISARNGGLGMARRVFSGEYFRRVAASPRTLRGGVIFLTILAYVWLFGNSWLAKLNFTLTFGDVLLPVNTGFILITFGYLFATFVYLKAMSAHAAAVVSLAAALAIFFVFNKGFGIPIP